MENIRTIGQMIGVVGHSFNITNDNKDKVSLSIKIDFSTASDSDIRSWLTSNRTIQGQRPWRALSLDELNDLNGTTFIAQNIGCKVPSRAEQIQTLVNAGLPKSLAEFKLDNPAAFAAAMVKAEESTRVVENVTEE